MKPGIYTDLTYQQYDAVKAFSNTWASYLDECPALLKYNMQFNQRKDTPALKMGRAVHEAVFEPRKFGSGETFVESRKFGRTKVEQEAKDLFLSQHEGKTVLDQDEYCEATEIASAVLRTKTGSSLINGSQSEVSIFWTCPDTGVLCKGRIDAWNKKESIIIDLKTTSDSLSEESLKRVIAIRRYYRQLAWYSYGLDLLGEPSDLQVLIFVQKRKPYLTAFRPLSFSSVVQGKAEMQQLVKQYAKCLESNEWPGLPDKLITIELAAWAQKTILSDEEQANGFSLYTDQVHEEMVNNGI